MNMVAPAMICLALLLAECGGPLRGDASAGPNPGSNTRGRDAHRSRGNRLPQAYPTPRSNRRPKPSDSGKIGTLFSFNAPLGRGLVPSSRCGMVAAELVLPVGHLRLARPLNWEGRNVSIAPTIHGRGFAAIS
jgi:hypothetical protein